MENAKLVEYLLKIQNSDCSLGFARNIEKELLSYGPIHPSLDYQLAAIYYMNGRTNKTIERYKHIVKNEIINGYSNYNTSLSDSAGMSAAYLLLNVYDNHKDIKDLFLFSFLYLSSNIKIVGDMMADSFKHRAYLTEKFQNVFQGIAVSKLGVLSFIPIPSTIGDYYFAARGYHNYGASKFYDECIERAIYLHEWLEDIVINGKAADEYSLDRLALLGRQRTDLILEEISDLNVFDGSKILKILDSN
ncbi:MAG: hypothetical protein Q7T92_01070 [Lutibacter sp.]|nr:hypothetical protein [Lutibacter sp.]